MRNDKIIAQRKFSRVVGGELRKATAMLHHLEGNARPYFSVTGEVYEKSKWGDHYGREPVMCGCCHEMIAETWPELAPLIALHLSDDNGQPTHGAANGWYWLAGALGGMGERYHGGSGESYSAKSPIDCLMIFANYVRISAADAVRLANSLARKYRISAADLRADRLAKLRAEYGQHINVEDFREYTDVGKWLRAPTAPDRLAKAELAAWCEAQRDRWAAEAAAGLAYLKQR
jgi:hypothetical protein